MSNITRKAVLGATLGPTRWGLLMVAAIAGAMVVAMLTGPVSSSKQSGIAPTVSTDSTPQMEPVRLSA